ncbi:CoA ester lyase [Microbacterium jejuense]|uniref:CoA ester lyase n=1 Tax=Microbacterium jejuense TaxID=1263637 RepID=A0ABS7HJP9_9MICO|nr:CoA ester lyase [Microbacterium jejuense]MBW9093048.1 CoA ester lyase [Microbacterium jejuense]
MSEPTTGLAPAKRITADVARSWLLVSALNADDFDSAHLSLADQIVLDIEDAVDPSLKPAARSHVAGWLSRGGSAWVRINDRTTEHWNDDVDRLRNVPGLLGVMLAKTESPTEVTATFDRLGGSTPVIALIESALGIEEATAIARARGVFRLAFGSGDYRRDTGTSAEAMAMLYPRSRLVVASRIGDLPGPIDGPTVTSDPSAVHEQSELAVSLGLTGKLCLRDEHLPVINEAMSPAPADVTWAREFLADFNARGRLIRDGSDLPRLGRAEKIDQRARALGIN